MMQNAISTGASARTGASANSPRWTFAGMKSSLKIIFKASAMKWRMPHTRSLPSVFPLPGGMMLARFGPSRSCIIALWRRSAQVKTDASGITRPMIRNSHLVPPQSRMS